MRATAYAPTQRETARIRCTRTPVSALTPWAVAFIPSLVLVETASAPKQQAAAPVSAPAPRVAVWEDAAPPRAGDAARVAVKTTVLPPGKDTWHMHPPPVEDTVNA